MTVSVIVLNFNGIAANCLPGCLDSLGRQTWSPLQVIVVDNASPDDSVAYIARAHPSVLLVETGRPLGFGAANNLGYARASGDYVLFANNDTVFASDCIEQLVRAVSLAPAIGMAAPKLLRPPRGPGASPMLDSAGTLLRRELTMYDRGWETVDDGRFDVPEIVFAPTGAAAFFRREALESVRHDDGSLWDEDFHFYYEDGDLGWRLRNAGWRCVYYPAAVAEHRRGAHMPPKFFDKTPLFQVHTIKNRYLMIVKNATASLLIRNLPFFLARELFIWGYLLLHPRLMGETWMALSGSVGRARQKRRLGSRSGDETGLFAPARLEGAGVPATPAPTA